MAVTQFLDGVPCTVKEAFDFSFLRQWGRVFRAFDQQDSGNLCFGLEKDGRRYFLKFAGARPICFDGEPGEAVRLLKKSAQVYRDLAHPILLPMLWDGPAAGGYALLFPWTDALCMGKQYPTRNDFLAMPLKQKLSVFQAALDFHRYVAEKGYVSVDFYDGCVLYETETGRPLLCDVDAYHQAPFCNPIGRMWGSTRFMAPEEYCKGAPIDEATMVYTWSLCFRIVFTSGKGSRFLALASGSLGVRKKSGLPSKGRPLLNFMFVFRCLGASPKLGTLYNKMNNYLELLLFKRGMGCASKGSLAPPE